MTPETIALIKEREGFSQKVYADTLGFKTAGYGHKLSATDPHRVGDTIPGNVSDSWFQHDLFRAESIAQKQCAEIGEPQLLDALTCVAFQLGDKLETEFPHTWQALKAHDWELASEDVQDSLWFKETPVRVKDFQAALAALENVQASVQTK